MDIYTILSNQSIFSPTTAGQLPQLYPQRCVTCHLLNCSRYLTSTRTGITYNIRHNFTCASRNLIYLIMCTKIKKQYVGLTTKQLNIRINHHRTNIVNHKQIYLGVHFNFSDHSIDNLSIQAINRVFHHCPNPLQELQKHPLTSPLHQPKGMWWGFSR